MNEAYAFQVRVTGVLIEKGAILLVKQRISESRAATRAIRETLAWASKQGAAPLL